MRCARLVGVVVVVGVWAAGRGAAEGPVLPDLPSTQMQMHLSWQDFKQLLATMGPAPAERVELPPAEWAIAESRYDARVIEGDSVRVEGHFEIMVWKRAGWVSIPVLGATVAPVGARLDGEEVSMAVQGGNWFTLFLDQPGRHVFDVEFFVQYTPKEGAAQFSFPCAPTSVTRMTLTLPLSDAIVTSPNAATVSTQKSDGSVKAELVFRSADAISVEWRLPAAPGVEKPVEEARVTSVTSTLATVTDRYIGCASQVRFEVLRGAVDTFRFGLPADANVLSVEAEGSAWSRSEADDTQSLEVKVNHLVKDRLDVFVRYERALPEEPAAAKVPSLGVRDVVRETGYIGVTALGNVEIQEGTELAGLTRVDPGELPASLRAMAQNPILHAFRYVDGAYSLAVDVRKLEDVAVRVAGIDRAELTTMVTEDGMAVTRVAYDIRNNHKQFVRVKVPTGAEVWSAEVAGQAVKPAQDNASDEILIPLLKSAEINEGMGTFPVELVYMERLGKIGRVAGKISLKAPSADILANGVRWNVMVPETRRVYRTTGDVKPDKHAGGIPGPVVRREIGRSSERPIRVKEGIERYFITDINRPAASNIGQGADNRYKGPLLDAGAAGAASDVAVAGVLPIRIDIPTEGVTYGFRRVLVPQDTPLSLTLYVYHRRLQTLGKSLLFVAGAAIVFALSRRVRARWHGRRAALLGASVLLVALFLWAGFALRANVGAAFFGGAIGLAAGLCRAALSGRSAEPSVPASVLTQRED